MRTQRKKPRSFQPLTRLQKGYLVTWHGRRYRVVLVNDCRAVLRPTHRRRVTVRDRFGRERKVRERVAPISISPNSELPAA